MTDLVEFRMPDVGEGIAVADVLQWFAEVGDTVTVDQPMVQVETDKSIVEIPAPATGTLLRQCVPVGKVAKVNDLLAVIGDPATVPAGPALPSGPTVPLGAGVDADVAAGTESFNGLANGATAPASASAAATPRRRPMASPRTRRLAVQRGIDLTAVLGTGPHGRILEVDLDNPTSANGFAAGAKSAPDARTGGARINEVVELRGLRRSIARSMTEALTIPHVTEFREVDATNLLAARAALKPAFEAKGVRFSVFPLLLKAVIRALAIQPSLNATYEAATETLTKHAGVHLGMATATDDGLIVPVIRDADLLNLTELAIEVERLAARARTRTATREELTSGSFTVTNFGSFGTWIGTPIIRPPEVGIAGFGRITDKVIAVEGHPAVRPVLPIVVAIDHRINDGAHLAEFVNAVADAVSQPLLLLS
ncbi:MAG: Dihydrolipoamide acetyltransferase component of pyruvate dehydrogenase complex [Mycobacterium sp.]|nr:Dihydrolipoamide acetyltransferase component of pyruvate dehydrogenase complex [Mycobacterium sp.]MCW2745377.1 Dihydrolipoamide acetyltransferase component of pyruvate dehydrogenase complex [Mycobacterium sp.]